MKSAKREQLARWKRIVMNIQDSMTEILSSEELLGDMFYSVFLARFPDVQEHFDQVNMKRQGIILTMSLTLVEQYARNPMPATRKYLEVLGQKHHSLGIAKELYPKWKTAMMITLQNFHGDCWHDAIAAEWEEALESTIAVLLEGYADESNNEKSGN